MSQEFIEFNFPCVECLVRAACKDAPKKISFPTNISIDNLYNKKNLRCLTFPPFTEKPYHKMFMECMSNLTKRLTDNINQNDKIPSDYILLFSKMASVMQYMVNSTSWKLGTLQSFDIEEINLKLKWIKL